MVTLVDIPSRQTLAEFRACIGALITEYDADQQVCQRVAVDLLAHVTRMSFQELICAQYLDLDERQRRWLADAINRLIIKHEPLAYIVATVQFLDAVITVRPPVLIPRPETEYWVNELIQQLPADKPLRILDLCSGSGCIAIAVAQALPLATVVAVDIEEQAVRLAAENVEAAGLSARIQVYQGDLFEPVMGRTFDLIVANPPYIPLAEKKHLSPSVLEWEDERALFAGADGLTIIKKIMREAPAMLSHTHQIPSLVMEIDITQAEAVCALAVDAYQSCQIRKDQYNRDRVAYLWL